MIKATWTQLRQYITGNSVTYQWTQDDNSYTVSSNDSLVMTAVIPIQTPASFDQQDFETNFKSTPQVAASQFDTDGAQITRNKAAKKGWTFCSLPIEFVTSRLQTGNTTEADDLYSRDSADVTRNFITQKIYNNSDVEITTPGLLDANYANAVKTVIDFEPPYDYEIIGGDLRTLNAINVDVRLWLIAAPDVAAPLGSKEMGGGINLRYLSPGNVWSVDGRVTKFAAYNNTLHTNKIRMIFKYPAGTKENIQIIIQLYKA